MSKWETAKETAISTIKVDVPKVDNGSDIVAASIIAASLIRTGATKSAIPREAAIMVLELRKSLSDNL